MTIQHIPLLLLMVTSLVHATTPTPKSPSVSRTETFHQRMLGVTYVDNCDTMSGDDLCCSADARCDEVGDTASVAKGSCRGHRACSNMLAYEGVGNVGEYSCTGYEVCTLTGYYGTAIIGDRSCTGQKTCNSAGRSQGYYEVGNDSCNGSFTCYATGEKGRAIIGNGSCVGENSCEFLGKGAGNEATVGDNSCNGSHACHGLQHPSIVIGYNACNCHNCCKCLQNGDIVPNDACNTLGSNQCCSSNTAKGTMDLSLPLSTSSPTNSPTKNPTIAPTNAPTDTPTNNPSTSPTDSPTTSLPVKFTLSPPQCTVDVSNTVSVGDVSCGFTDIEGPSDATVSMQVLGYDCVSVYNSTAFDDTAVTVATSQTQGVTTFNAVANVDPASGYAGDVQFCIRTDLKDATSGETMSFRSERISITMSYNGSFTVTGFETTPFVGINQDATVATKNFGVTATVCDSAGTTITSPPALSLGTNLFICIKTQVVGTKIPSIISFVAKKDTESEYDVATPSPNVVIRGLDSADVKVVINLPARFFADTTNILLSGRVTVTRDDSRRSLATSRSLTEDIAPFKLDIQVNDDGDGDDSASVRVRMMITAVYGVAALLFI